MKVRVFRYHPDKDAFSLSENYRYIAEKLHLFEWNPVVWIGRLFFMDNDFGKNWLDNYDLLKKKELDDREFFVLDHKRFTDGTNGPCNTDTMRKAFWTDVLCSLELDLETLFAKARDNREYYLKEIARLKSAQSHTYAEHLKRHYLISDLDYKIKQIKKEFE